MTKLEPRKDSGLERWYLSQINEACLEVLRREERKAQELEEIVSSNVRTFRMEQTARVLAGSLKWASQSPLVDRWMELECRIIDPATGEVKETKVFRKRSHQQIKQARHMDSAGRIVAPLNTMIVDAEGNPDHSRTFGMPQGHRMTKWSAEHGRLTAEERKAIKKRQKIYRQMSETAKSPVKSRQKQLDELASQIDELKKLIALLG